MDYSVNAPFGSINYHIGKIAIGGSLRYDFGTANGAIYSADLGGGRVGSVSRDINGDGVISMAETKVTITPLTAPAPVKIAAINISLTPPASTTGWPTISRFSGVIAKGRAPTRIGCSSPGSSISPAVT